MGDKNKKKLTKKELKAQNHAKLMASKGHGQQVAPVQTTEKSNVVDINAFRPDQQKKAS